MKRIILVTGASGYIGNALIQRLLKEENFVVGVDNDLKLGWLSERNSVSALPVPKDSVERSNLLNKHFKQSPYDFYYFDIAEQPDVLEDIFREYKFDTVINLAQQPSGPYSQISLKEASFSIKNNTIGTLNILWMMKKYCPDAHLIEIESMGTFCPHINTDIPEGKFEFEYNGRKSLPSIFPKQAGSFYHSSKVNNTYLCDNANRWWGIKSTAINQGVVYGNWTPEIEKSKIHSHLSTDECFGTVLNRFIVQAAMEVPLTIYGEGDQKRGFLALNDSIQCIQLFVENPPEDGEMRLVNQLDEVFSMNDLAGKVLDIGYNEYNLNVNWEHIEAPRIENTSDFYYNPETETLKKLGFDQTRSVEDEIRYILNNIDKKHFPELKKLVSPEIKWK